MEEKKFLEKIKKEFPNLKWKKHQFLNHGWDNFAMVLDDKIVLRTPKRPHEYEKDELYNETRLVNYLRTKVKVGIPKFIYLSSDKTIAGYKMLDGKELKPSAFKRLGASDKEKFAKQLAGFITTLHSTPKSIIKKYKVKSTNIQKDYNELVRNAKKITFPKLNKKEKVLVEKFFEDLKMVLDKNYPSVLIHTDLKWEHLLWDKKNKKLNIIDFSDREFGDPAIDFTSLWAFGDKFAKQVYELYNGPKDEQFLYRSKLYFKKIPLLVIQGALGGYPLGYKEAYKMFKERF